MQDGDNTHMENVIGICMETQQLVIIKPEYASQLRRSGIQTKLKYLEKQIFSKTQLCCAYLTVQKTI